MQHVNRLLCVTFCPHKKKDPHMNSFRLCNRTNKHSTWRGTAFRVWWSKAAAPTANRQLNAAGLAFYRMSPFFVLVCLRGAGHVLGTIQYGSLLRKKASLGDVMVAIASCELTPWTRVCYTFFCSMPFFFAMETENWKRSKFHALKSFR